MVYVLLRRASLLLKPCRRAWKGENKHRIYMYMHIYIYIYIYAYIRNLIFQIYGLYTAAARRPAIEVVLKGVEG